MRCYIKPHAAAAGIGDGVTVEYVRHLRRCGYLQDIGVREGKEFVYSVGDIIRIAVALHLTGFGFPLRRAFNAIDDYAAKLEALGLPGALHAGADLILEFAADDSGITLLASNATAIAEQVIGRLAKFKINNPA